MTNPKPISRDWDWYKRWFDYCVARLSPVDKRYFDDQWGDVCKNGMENEIYELTYDNFKDLPDDKINNVKTDEKFMRALFWATNRRKL